MAACATGWKMTGPPGTSAAEAVPDFSFTAVPLGPADRPGDRSLRPVAPGYRSIRAWASSTGAGVALFDADNTAVSNDVCLVDPRHDTVTVSPVPGTPRGYRPFTLVAPGRRPYEAPMGCLPVDLDQDGWQDLVVYYWGRSPSLFLRVPGVPPSRAAFRRRDLTAEPEVWNTSAATVGDFDGDGRLDLVFGNYFPDGARVLDKTGDHGDIAMPDSLSDARNGGTNRLYRATGPARFAEVKGVFDEVGGKGWTLALGTQDLDGDGRPDLYVTGDFGPDRLLVNESTAGRIRFREAQGTRDLTTPRSSVVGQDSFEGMGVGFTDLNADGTPDILVSNIAENDGWHGNNFAFVSRPGGFHDGHAPYEEHGEDLGLSRSGWSWDVKAADFDNDGTDEIMHATGSVRDTAGRWARLREGAISNDPALSPSALWPDVGTDPPDRDANSFFTRGADGRYVDVARRAGVGGDAAGRSFAVGDVNDDGRLDFVVANQWSASVFYRNDGATAPFVGLRLRLPAGSCGTAAAPTGTGRALSALLGPLPSPLPPGRPGMAIPALVSPDPFLPPSRRSAVPVPALTRPAIGATARMRLPGGTTLSRQLYPANGHNGVSAPELLFGLGTDAPGGLFPVELSWRDACGVPRTASVSVKPGWHRILLADGHASEMN
ncbi:FG-GAP repeat domain-containing protein [Streptosporangium sp. NPDC087985]|uniref:FG-GAP repeat domain-containing protein n=1 Tax=Streptosporangium sp. NPDC087985 TaxID=3366196 RepID=UPI00382FA03C